jgi:hypothetical protein
MTPPLLKKILWLCIPTFIGITWLLAAPTLAITISPAIPGMASAPTAGTSPGAFVSGFYNFALMIGGVLAFGAIVYGGILYAASAGNPGKQSEGKEWVKSALLGLFLLAAAYLILFTINPNLVNLNLPTLQAISIQAPAQQPTNPAQPANPEAITDCNGQTGNRSCYNANCCLSNNQWVCQSQPCSSPTPPAPPCSDSNPGGACENPIYVCCNTALLAPFTHSYSCELGANCLNH